MYARAATTATGEHTSNRLWLLSQLKLSNTCDMVLYLLFTWIRPACIMRVYQSNFSQRFLLLCRSNPSGARFASMLVFSFFLLYSELFRSLADT